MKVIICIGSACHLKGSRQVAETLQSLLEQYSLMDRVEYSRRFCLGSCQQGVCVTVDGALFSVAPETVRGFFEEHILSKQ